MIAPSCLGIERLSETCPCLRSKQLINESSLNHLDYRDTLQKINIEPENDGFQVRNLLFQGVSFRWTMLNFGECIWVCILKNSPRCNQWHPRSKSCSISPAHADNETEKQYPIRNDIFRVPFSTFMLSPHVWTKLIIIRGICKKALTPTDTWPPIHLLYCTWGLNPTKVMECLDKEKQFGWNNRSG